MNWSDSRVTECPVELIEQFCTENIKSEKIENSKFSNLNKLWKGQEINQIQSEENIPTFKELIDPESRDIVRKQMLKVSYKLYNYNL